MHLIAGSVCGGTARAAWTLPSSVSRRMAMGGAVNAAAPNARRGPPGVNSSLARRASQLDQAAAVALLLRAAYIAHSGTCIFWARDKIDPAKRAEPTVGPQVA